MRLRPSQGSSRPARTRPIRSTLAALLVVPLVSLVVLWAYETGITASQAVAQHDYAVQYTLTSGPGQELLNQLSQERIVSFSLLSGPPTASRSPLNAQRTRTDAAVAAFRRAAASAEAQGVLGTEARQSLTRLLGDLDGLPSIREVIDSGQAAPVTMWRAYNAISDATFSFLGSQSTSTAVDFSQQAEATLNLSLALEMARREGALVGGALVSRGRLTPPERGLFAQAMGAQRMLVNQSVDELEPPLAAPFEDLFSSDAYHSVAAVENQIAAPGQPTGSIPALSRPWVATANAYLAAFDHAVVRDRAAVGAGVRQQDYRTLLRLALTAGLGLLAIAASVLLLLRYGRRLARELTSLQHAAQAIAGERLPQVVDKLQQGEDVDPAADAIPVERSRTSEVELVGVALSTLQLAAMEAAVGQARLRHSVSQVFLNLSRRNQSLLHRQLSMLDAMERGTGDPDALGDLFRLDHLTTRMRRHAEGLIILSGAAPARGWRAPVPVIDVLRAAIAEVEDYVRVDVITEATDAIVGTAAADVVHLLAELVENATMFSPSTTRVDVRASRVGNGFAVEIEDRGIGIPPETIAELNQRLGSPPEFSLEETDQLGLFVVGRLASRHSIRVALRESAYGGVTAIVLLPHSLVLAEEDVRAFSDRGQEERADGQAAVSEPAFGLTGRRQAVAAPPEAPRFMGPALPPRPAAPAAGDPAGPRLVTADSGAWPAVAEPVTQGPLTPRVPPAAGPRHALPATAATGQPAATAGWQPAGAAPDGGEYRGLPRRVRQASLAPQLRRDPPGPVREEPEAAASQLRSPDEARSVMAALQQGWQRGREDDADAPTGEQPAVVVDPGASPATGEDEERS